MDKRLQFVLFFIFLLHNHQCAETLERNLNPIMVKIPGLGTVIGSKTYSSWTNQTILQFMGIPYAESPSNGLRFKPPVPKSKWNRIHNGTKFGRPCPNRNNLRKLTDKEKLEDPEDCLNLYVYTKNVKKYSPVMVYIHGGALVTGSAIEHMPNYLLEKDIVYVAIQYRLGALGFLSTQTKDIPGNMGVLDTILALQWIKKKIQYFGGNPAEITVFGESAGGCILSLLTVTPKLNKYLFKRAIIQSGSYLISQIHQKNPIQEARKMCQQFRCNDCKNINNINECLKSASLQQLVNANNDKEIPFGFTSFDYEGVAPIKLENLGKEQKNIDEIMIGANKQDGAFLLKAKDLNNTPRRYLDYLIKQFDEDNYSGVIGNIFSKLLFKPEELNEIKINLKEMLPSIVDIASTMGFKSPIQKYVDLYSEGLKKKYKIYLYVFNYVGEQNYISRVNELQKLLPYFPIVNGTHHADDLLYLFPPRATRGHALNVKDTEIAKTMIELWTTFAINGIPKTKNIILPNIKTPNGPYFHINAKITIGSDFTDDFFVKVHEKDNF